MKTRPKRPPPVGSRWRILAHGPRGERIDIESRDYDEGDRAKPRTVFDELVIDDWLHLEQMSARVWWLKIGDDMVMISVGSDGKAKMGEWYR